MKRLSLVRERRDAPLWRFFLVGAVVVGVFLRIRQLSTQMLIDDEWHAVRMLLRADFTGIATHFGLADYSIPLTLYYRWLYLIGSLNEWQMHLPLLLAGCALLVVAPVLLRDAAPLSTRALWTALLAISPSLIYFSRTARPYALIALLGFVAVLAFRKWWRGGDARLWATLYVAATFVAAWLHILSLVFTLWPFVHYAVRSLAGRRQVSAGAQSSRSLAGILGLGVVTTGALAIALLPPLLNEWSALAEKAGTDSATFDSVYRTALMQLGIRDAWLLLMVLACGALGVCRLWRRDRDFVVLTLGAAVVGGVAICIARPAWIQHAPVLVRYTAPVLPFLLFYVADGLAAAIAAVSSALTRTHTRMTAAILSTLCVVALVIAGPLPTLCYVPNQFMDHAIFQFDYDPRVNPYATLLELGPVPKFYLDLARQPPQSVTLVEAPNRAQSNFMPDPWLQKMHRQNVKFALVGELCGKGEWDELPANAPALAFDRLLKLTDVINGASHADYLVMRFAPWKLPPGDKFPWPVPWPDMGACVTKVAATLGAPIFRDDQIVVFALPGASASSSASR